jgi:hypothetical protein
MKRKKVPINLQSDVLIKSKRRCALCFGINGDLTEKKGQLAHLDGNKNNNTNDNLAFLCLIHHDAYDSTTSVSKNYTIIEIRKYKLHLISALRNGKMADEGNAQYSDIISITSRVYDFFMGYPSYGLVVHDGSRLLDECKDVISKYSYLVKLHTSLIHFRHMASIVFDDMTSHADTQDSKKNLNAAFNELKYILI